MKYKILVVDDDKELVKMLCSYFNMKQYETITATDGMEALNKIKMKPDIILLDINMPRMRKMSHLEQRELQCSEIELSELAKKIEAEAAMLSKKESKLCKVERVQEQNIVKVDEELVMEVTDNLLENAVRYAQKSIALQIKKKDGFLIISVEDDGIGFVDTEEKVTEPFYHKNPQDDLKHFGLGMYISRIFCEKHGGNLKIYNARQGGAHVEALFKAE